MECRIYQKQKCEVEFKMPSKICGSAQPLFGAP